MKLAAKKPTSRTDIKNNSDCTKKISGRSARQAGTLNEGSEEWLGEQGQGEGENMMEMGEVKESVNLEKECVLDLGKMNPDPGAQIIS